MAKHPRLMLRGTVYYFRAKVPVDLLEDYSPKREICFSLRTRDPREALEKVRIESVRLDQEFAAQRRKLAAQPLSTISDAEADRLGALHLHRLLYEDEELRFQGTGDAEVFAAVHTQVMDAGGTSNWEDGEAHARYGISPRGFDQLEETQHWTGEMLREALARGDISVVEDEVDDLLEVNGLSLKTGSEPYRKVAVAVLKASVRAAEMRERRQRGEVVETPTEPAPLSLISATPDPGSDGIAVSTLWKLYRDERQLPTKTASDFGTYLRRFVEVNGDLAASAVTRAHVRAFKDAMLKLPARPKVRHKGLTVPQIIEDLIDQPDVKRLSVRTVNDKALGAVSAVFGYAVENGYRDDNPATRVKASGPKNDEPSRIPFNIEDLKLIFGTPVFTEGERPKGGGGEAAKWLPLLALYTGARLEELGGLRLDDIGEEQGVPYIFIRAAGERRRLKTRSSRRKVPLHPQLERLGFLDYVARLRRSRSDRLFPDLRSERTEVTAAFSKWWNRYIRRHGLADTRKVFHSFRHLVKRQLRNAGVEKTLRDALQGHATQGVAETYGLDEEGFGVSLPVLGEAIKKLEYSGLDLSHLRD